MKNWVCESRGVTAMVLLGWGARYSPVRDAAGGPFDCDFINHACLTDANTICTDCKGDKITGDFI